MTIADFLRDPDPLRFLYSFWPHVRTYRKQNDTILSVKENDETFIQAANMMGKDWVAGYIALSFFLCPQMYFSRAYVQEVERWRSPSNQFPHTRRVLTTSVAEQHLDLLWGEIGRFTTTAVPPLLAAQGGPLVLNSKEIRFAWEDDSRNALNYLKGMVAAEPEKMAGHHAAYTLMIVDEASSAADWVYSQGQGWAKKWLVFGNPNPCANFFYRACTGGDLA